MHFWKHILCLVTKIYFALNATTFMRFYHFIVFSTECDIIIYSTVCVVISQGGISYTMIRCQNGSIISYVPQRRFTMAVSYKRLWKLLIDKDMKKKDLCEQAGISSASVTKLGRNGHVTTEILLKICTALNCQIEDVMEIVPEDKWQIKSPRYLLIFWRYIWRLNRKLARL